MAPKINRQAGLMTHVELAKHLGVSKCRVQQLERRALAKVRSAIEREARLSKQTPLEWLMGE